jgi:hypothetical protein
MDIKKEAAANVIVIVSLCISPTSVVSKETRILSSQTAF